MTDEEKQALLASVKHWEQNVVRKRKGFDIKSGAEYCPCCRLQRERQGIKDDDMYGFQCFHETGNCPIAVYTGVDSCDLTPYYYARNNDEPEVEANWLWQLYRYLTGESKTAPELWDIDDDELWTVEC